MLQEVPQTQRGLCLLKALHHSLAPSHAVSTTSACGAAQWVPDAGDERPCLWTASAAALMWSQSTASSFTPAQACSTQPDDHVQEHEGKCLDSLRNVWYRLVHKDGTASRPPEPDAARREQRGNTARSFFGP